jgi:hypothetical protein
LRVSQVQYADEAKVGLKGAPVRRANFVRRLRVPTGGLPGRVPREDHVGRHRD